MADKVTYKALIWEGLRHSSDSGLADLQDARLSPPAKVLGLLIATPTTALRSWFEVM